MQPSNIVLNYDIQLSQINGDINNNNFAMKILLT